MATSAQRLGELVRERREVMGIYTVVEAASLAGLTGQTWAKVEAGKPAKPVTYRKIEDALQWQHGSCGAVLGGGEPSPVGSDQTPTEKDPLDDPRFKRISELIRELNYEFDQVRSSLDNEESRKRHGR